MPKIPNIKFKNPLNYKKKKPAQTASKTKEQKSRNSNNLSKENLSEHKSQTSSDNKRIKPKFNIFNFFNKKKPEQKKRDVEHPKKQIVTEGIKHAISQKRRHKLRYYIGRSGLDINPDYLSKILFRVCIGVNLIISAFLIYHFSVTRSITWMTILTSVATLWVLVFIILVFILWILFYIVIDLKIFQRKVEIEDVLSDYLQLTASNIKSGMTIDRALWYAVRPRFGVLAKEIEIVAKDSMRGEDLKIALQRFADKYESVLLKRSISLLIEGIEAGGEIGNLLNKIALNIQENKIIRKEMAANVTTYVIFISFATIAAAPVLFALSGVLIKVITNLGSTLGDSSSAASTAGFALSFSSAGIKYDDFRIFAIVNLIITSFFSSIIIATIQKGDAKLGFKYIPIFIIVTITLFLIADNILGMVVGTFI